MNAAVATLTLVHVLLSLVGLAAGFVVLWGLLSSRQVPGWTALFLSTTIATSVSGFLFPVDHVTPGHVLGILSLVVLPVAVVARYQRRLLGPWRVAYVLSAVTAQYLNFFVLIVQVFLKVPALKALAPTQTEPAFAISQLLALLFFLAAGALATIRFQTHREITHPRFATRNPARAVWSHSSFPGSRLGTYSPRLPPRPRGSNATGCIE
jgi:hypothetical protein